MIPCSRVAALAFSRLASGIAWLRCARRLCNTQFSSLQGLNIFRIIQEACNNALKYANANRINIKINKQGKSICFLVEDDGKGFVENEVEPGNGLLNMRKRAQELGGELKLVSEPGTKTSVSFKVL